MAEITLGRYVWERIHQVGVDTIFGCPGDFNLQFLDAIFQVEGLKWVGNQNELNAAYAADGYGRIKGVPGCVVTTHGVGELSALNGIAGSKSELVKTIHVVGQTTRAMQKNHMMIHHSIGNTPDHQVYNRASKELRFAAAELWDVETAPHEIDRVIRECFINSGPVYIFLPLDLSAEKVPKSLLDTPIDIAPTIDEAAQDTAVKAITSAISSAEHPIVLVDALVKRFGASSEARELAGKLRVPVFSANMGKGVVDETDENYVGVWNGEICAPGVKEEARKSDLVITLGYLPADTNSAGFSRRLSEEGSVHINPFEVVVQGKSYPNTPIKFLLSALIAALPSSPQHSISKPNLPPPRVPKDKDATDITQSSLWPSIQSYLQPNDIVISETGTSTFGLCDIQFPPHTRYEAQIYYGSIGWATAATLGAAVARKELGQPGRTLLFTGDGSMAMTIQEIGTMIKAGLKIVLFVINNEGYTVERLIWGAREAYNDIVSTDYSHLLPLFKHPSPSTSYHFAKTKTELDAVLAKPEIRDPMHLQLVEIVVPKLDTSWRLASTLAWRGKEAQEYLTREGFTDTYGGWGLDGEDSASSGGGVSWK
ncbi:pyruvate decarboxylase-like protein [Byssothecium circinans]|uniref:Pyruvate decarboxylase n=1 Tax=Byssothecium circinans TaxID=147558 RepID=A0A6A5U1U3_9PLEO|nr:pyruvate decarboxylase-like protein [Byssothecium circinans]